MKNVEDVYSLTPMQDVMLLHAATNRSDDVLFNQFCFEIRGKLDADAFAAAWRRLCDRHAILRSAFVWEGLKNPVQIVHKKVDLPFDYLDWSDRSEARQLADLGCLRATDRRKGFDPTRAPLLRVTLIRRSDSSHYYVWSSHHLLLDRWCLGTVFDELSQQYRAAIDGAASAAPPAHQFRDYIRWVRRQDPAEAESYWRETLAGFAVPTPMTQPGEHRGAEHCTLLPREDVDALHRLCRACGVTVGVLIQGAWALLQNRLHGHQDVVFGTVAAGRPPGLSGVESIIGSFINNLPVRVVMPRDAPLGEWLRSLQQRQHQRSAFEYVSPGDIQRWSGLPGDATLFDTLLVALAAQDTPAPEGLEFVPLDGQVTTAYPLTLSIGETEDGLEIGASQRRGFCTAVPPADLLDGLRAELGAIVAATAEARLGELPGFRGTATRAELETSAASAATRRRAADDRRGDANAAAREGVGADVMQELLHAEWQSLLGAAAIGPDDDFFALGGTSLQALGLHARMQSLTRMSMPLLALYRATTLRGMAENLASGNWPLRAGTVNPIRERGSRPPMFCIASPEVNTVGYALLAQHLDRQRPVYVLQAQPDSESVRRPSPRELPALATSYCEAMREVQSRGPYHLLGMCTGAQITLEMARQLREQGERVAFAGVVDTWALYTVSWKYHVASLLNRARWYAGRLREIAGQSHAEQLLTVRTIAARRWAALCALAFPGARRDERLATPGGDLDIGAPPERVAAEDDPDLVGDTGIWIDEFGWARLHPGDAKYPGTVTVFRIDYQPFWRVGDRDLGWGRHAEHVEVEYLPGDDHHAILREPSVRTVGERIEALLANHKEVTES
jgi:thioesterase domain-containing protein